MNSNQPMDNNTNNLQNDLGVDTPESQDRRDLVTKLGKFAIYAAPFTVMALNSKASDTGSGPSRHKP